MNERFFDFSLKTTEMWNFCLSCENRLFAKKKLFSRKWKKEQKYDIREDVVQKWWEGRRRWGRLFFGRKHSEDERILGSSPLVNWVVPEKGGLALPTPPPPPVKRALLGSYWWVGGHQFTVRGGWNPLSFPICLPVSTPSSLTIPLSIPRYIPPSILLYVSHPIPLSFFSLSLILFLPCSTISPCLALLAWPMSSVGIQCSAP